ncbi:amidohydrolase family protein [uncultured Maribacter sp.]|uniref:amidohydrolase family protein n=1 Tax=uncultured Maribacter sp. TaxID=431308 RepID=UPI0026204D27|nr:amidohydrolase family protein [uncultured Maribacter sp.]
MKHYLKYLLLLVIIITNSCTNLTSNKAQEEDEKAFDTYVIKNVNIIPMTTHNEVIENAIVLIQNQKIISINDTIPDGAKTIDGKGKWLIPGLIDMHVHSVSHVNFGKSSPTQGATFFFNSQDMVTPYVINGVTTIFDLNSNSSYFALRNEIAIGDVIGPKIALAKLLNGGNDVGHVNTPSDGRQAVRSAKADGYHFIKTYTHLNKETFLAIVDEAKKLELKVIGHIPKAFEDRLEEAFVPNFSMVAHAEEFARYWRKDNSYKKALEYAKMAKENNTWVVPTLTVMDWINKQSKSLDCITQLSSLKYLHPIFQDKWINHNKHSKNSSPNYSVYLDSLVNFNNKLVRAFKETGVPIVTGTDAMCSGVVPGFSVHDELELLVEAGLTPEEVLISATRLPATWLGIDKKTGTIEAGKDADLILLNSNPLDNINNTRDIDGVFVSGTWLNKSKIDSMLSDLASRNNESLGKYKWKKRRTY